MRYILLLLITLVPAFAESPLLDSKTLMTFLPKNEIKEYMRMEHDTPSSIPGMTTALVQYVKMPTEADPAVKSIAVSIIDSIKYRSTVDTQIKPETEKDEKCIVNEKYPGKRNNETINADGNKSCLITFIVSGRFLVSVMISGSDSFSEAQKYIDMIDLKGLEAKAK